MKGEAFSGAMLGAIVAIVAVALYASYRYEAFKARTGLNLP